MTYAFEWDGVKETPVSAFEWDGADEEALDLFDTSVAVGPDPPPTDPPYPWPMLGCYAGANNTLPDEAYYDMCGDWPDILGMYHQGYPTQGWVFNVSAMNARIARGTIPMVTFTAKNCLWTMAEIANGDADELWIDVIVSQIAGLSAGELWFTLDHEFEVKVNQNEFVNGPLAYQPTNQEYADAFNYVCAKVKAARPTAKILYWYGSADNVDANDIGSRLDMDLVDIISFDPYCWSWDPPTETFEETVSGKLAWLRQRSWYNDHPIAFSEFGKDTRLGDSYCAAWYSNLRPRMQELGVIGAVLFSRNSGTTYQFDIIRNTNFPLSRAAFAASHNEAPPE